jgi:hypothetical protein
MTESKSLGAVSLAAGSYDAEKLRAGLDQAVTAKEDAQPEKVGKAVAAAVVSGGTDSRDPALAPDHVFADVDNGHGGTERVQVYAPPLAEQHENPIQSAGEEVDPDALEKQRKGAIGEALKGAEKKPAEDAREGESRTGAADPVAAEDDTISAAAPAGETDPVPPPPAPRKR